MILSVLPVSISPTRLGALVLVALVLVALVLTPATTSAQVFYPDDPMQVDPDRQEVAAAPVPQTLSVYYDYFLNAGSKPGRDGGAAMNVNTLGEVPRSSWFTPRHFYDPMSKAELRRGPTRSNPPDSSTTWRVVAGKAQGKAAGFQIVDGDGERYLLKFDPEGHMELATGAEAVSTRLFYALGYHVPQNYVVRFPRERLEPDSGATYETITGNEAPITDRAVDKFLSSVPQSEDGSYRALASLFIAGKPLGPFQYHGRRSDDPNDLFPHEMRRELRGLRVFAAWVNHDDSRSANSFTSFVEENGRQFVRHYLIDFGTTLGGGPAGAKSLWSGHERIVEGDLIALSTLTLGLAGRPWRSIDVPSLPAVGTFEAEYFDPTAWTPQYYNPAFQNMDADDAFWAAKQVANFTDAEIRAMVKAGRYSRTATVDYLTRTLAIRRDKIARAYLPHGGGLGRFAVTGGALTFEDFLAHPAFDQRFADTETTVEWHRFNNRTGRRTEALGTSTATDGHVRLPETSAPYIVAIFRRPDVEEGTTEVFLRHTEDRREVVGIRRTEGAAPRTPPTWTRVPEKPHASADAP